jgi:hypothetical protein
MSWSIDERRAQAVPPVRSCPVLFRAPTEKGKTDGAVRWLAGTSLYHFPQVALDTVIAPRGGLDRHPAPFETVAPRPPQGEDFS